MTKIKKANRFSVYSWLIIFINLFMNLLFISKENFSNEYYSAAVKSMLMNFKNFFFVSFDPTGFLTVDKPALGLWIQAISAKIFGFNTFALLLPSIISSAAVCFLIYKIMSESFGEIYGLIAQIVFCFTPIVIAVSRTNNLDMTLMLFMMLSIYFTIKSCKQKKFSYFILAMIMLGLAFNIKMFQAYMIAPALFLYFIISNKISWKTFFNCVMSGIILLVVSFSWTIIVEMTPEDSRPFIGGSGSDNSVISLMFGHNGFERLTGKRMKNMHDDKMKPPNFYMPNSTNQNHQPPFQNNKSRGVGFDEIGNAGIFRLFDLTGASMYEQASWMLLPALFCIAALFFYKKLKFLNSQQIKIIILWSACLLPMIIFFDIAGFFHRYYLAMMAPSIACLFAALCYIFQNISFKFSKSLMFILFCATFFIQLYFVVQDKLIFLALTMLIEFILFILANLITQKYVPIIIFISLITAPAIYSFSPLFTNINSSTPAIEINKNGFDSNMHHKKNSDSTLTQFLLENRSNEKYFLAVSNCNEASNLILNTDLNVISINGFEGTDNTLTLEKLKSMISNNEIKYYLVGNSRSTSDINNWVEENAKLVYVDQISGDSPQNHDGHKLYDLTNAIK